MNKKILMIMLVAFLSVTSLFALSDDVFTVGWAGGIGARGFKSFAGISVDFLMLHPVKGNAFSHGFGTRLCFQENKDSFTASSDEEFQLIPDATVISISSGYAMQWNSKDCRLECNLMIGPGIYMNQEGMSAWTRAKEGVDFSKLLFAIGGGTAGSATWYFNNACTFGINGKAALDMGCGFTPSTIPGEEMFDRSLWWLASVSVGFRINYRGLMPWDK